jgi:translation initiation factor 2B subunit (eIF-2B alpha/beta/delta family)
LDTGALNPEAIGNVRNSAGELGKVIANLPFAFGKDAQKIRFSDVPPALQDLMEKMITRVEDKIGKKDADIATQGMKDFMSGQEVYSQSEISSQMSKLLRLLT